MKINALPIKVTEEEAIEIAKNGKGSVLSRIFLKYKKVHEARLHYIEFKLVTIEIQQNKDNKANILKVLINGSTGSGSIAQDVVPISITSQDVDEDIIQYSDKDDTKIRSKAIKMTMRITHKFMGKIPEIKIIKIDSIFRPYWVVFFDKVEKNKKVIYLPIEADGFKINKGF
ncbi:hypothetical protein [Clostridium sp. Marseille-Q7071]